MIHKSAALLFLQNAPIWLSNTFNQILFSWHKNCTEHLEIQARGVSTGLAVGRRAGKTECGGMGGWRLCACAVPPSLRAEAGGLKGRTWLLESRTGPWYASATCWLFEPGNLF